VPDLFFRVFFLKIFYSLLTERRTVFMAVVICRFELYAVIDGLVAKAIELILRVLLGCPSILT
jgi:hypothetical protein